MKKKLSSVLLALVLVLSLGLTVAVPALADGGVDVSASVYDATLNLENKDSSWSIKSGDGIGGTLGYNPSGSTFDYSLYATGLSDGDYALIYYADTEDRYVDWGGDYPGAVIGTGTSVGEVLSFSGNAELNMDLPCPPDANAYFYDYTQAPDNYAHATGAKIWLVPTSALTDETSLPVSTWPQTDDWLFETDLIIYDDDDVVSEMIAISVDPSSIDFGPLTPGTTGDGGDLTVSNAGNVSIDVTATAPVTGVFQYIELDGALASAYGATIPYLGSDVVTVTLPVPGEYEPAGPETGTLLFSATATS